MGSSVIQFSYFNGLGLDNKQQEKCRNHLKTKNDTVMINGNKWQSLKIPIFLSFIDQWNIKKALIVENVNIFDLHSIVSIKFPFLMNLSLAGNCIESIQMLACVWMPSIQAINLSDNKIISIKALRRMANELLKQVCLGQNPILQCNSLAESTNIEQISINNQISIDWSIKSRIKFNYLNNGLGSVDVLRQYNQNVQRIIIMAQLMTNF